MPFDTVNVLVNAAEWAWPEAVKKLFEPRGISSMVVYDAVEALDILRHRRIHVAVLDMDCEESSGLSTVKIIHSHYPLLPCILLAREPQQELLSKALYLDIFSVIDKPVDMSLLLEQLDRLFRKRYNSSTFEIRY
ncbi:MAG: response regulator [Planctomycetota bacterium]